MFRPLTFVVFAVLLGACAPLIGADFDRPEREALSDGGDTQPDEVPSGEDDPAAVDAGEIDGEEPSTDGGSLPCTVDTCTRETVLTDLYGPVTIASSGQYLYFVEVGDNIPQGGTFGWLSRVPTDMSCTQRSCFDVIEPYVYSGQLQGQVIYETHVEVGPNHVCFTQSFNGSPQHQVRCYDLVQFDKTFDDQSPGMVVDLWVGANDTRWAEDTALRLGSLTGTGSPASIGTERVGLTSVTSDGKITYFSELGASTNTGTVGAVLENGTVVPLATGLDAPTAARVYGGYVYWVEGGARKILRKKIDGTGSVEQIANTDEKPFALAVDGTGVYWACLGGGAASLEGSVAHAGLAPNSPVDVMMKDLPLIYDFAVDGTHVYAAYVGIHIEDGEIVRIPKTR